MPWIAGTEPQALKDHLGFYVTNLPEKYGVDILWRAKGGYSGAQRKEISDLIASVGDGRLAKEIQQMQLLDFRFLIVEGVTKTTTEGVLWKGFGRPWTMQQYRNLLRGVASQGVIVEQTASLKATGTLIAELMRWTMKEHRSLSRRAGPVSAWGKADNRDYQLHLLQGLPGIGIELAERIIDHLGMPLGWNVTKEELLTVPGLGQKKVDTIWAALKSLPISQAS